MNKGGKKTLDKLKAKARPKREKGKMKTKDVKSLEREILHELKENKKRLKRLAHIERYTLMEHPGRLLAFQLVLGIVRGVGSVLGATLVVAAVLWILSWFQVPAQVIEALGF